MHVQCHICYAADRCDLSVDVQRWNVQCLHLAAGSPPENWGLLPSICFQRDTSLKIAQFGSAYVLGTCDMGIGTGFHAQRSICSVVSGCIELLGHTSAQVVLNCFAHLQMLDCVSSSPSQDSRNGGWPEQALQWAVKNGQTSDANYPYKKVKGSCSSQKAVLNIDGYVTVSDSLNGVPGNTVTLLKVGLLQLTYKLQGCDTLAFLNN